MGKLMKNTILTILLTLTIWSCGTRKVQKSDEKIEVTKKDTTEVIVNTGKVENKTETEKTITEENSNWNYSEGTLSPINPDKPMTHTGPDGKTNTFTNTKIDFGTGSGNSIKQSETTKETKTETKDTSATKVNSGSAETIKKESSSKNTERVGASTNIFTWIGIAVAGCILIWFIWFIAFRKKKQE